MEVKELQHIDGKWFTSSLSYRGYDLQIKMRQSHGCKVHIWKNDKVIKTIRYSFAPAKVLVDKAKNFIDKINL